MRAKVATWAMAVVIVVFAGYTIWAGNRPVPVDELQKGMTIAQVQEMFDRQILDQKYWDVAYHDGGEIHRDGWMKVATRDQAQPVLEVRFRGGRVSSWLAPQSH